jgi:DNA invertase Pin-like site-specific DNA recombinase
MKAIGYVRVSTEGQAIDGVSLAAQEAKVRAWAELNGAILSNVYTDAGLSGGRADNRPGLQAALQDACANKAVLVVYSLSRLARSTRDAIAISERLDRAGADLVSLSERLDTTTAAGKMVFRMMAVLSEFEKDQLSERTSSAMQFMRTQNKRVGSIPFGWNLSADGITLVLNETEQAAIVIMARLRSEGKSLRQIAADLNIKGIQTKSGAGWAPKVILGILKRKELAA